MLTTKERELILAEFQKNMRNNQRAKGKILAEDESIMRGEYPGPGLHVHNEDNPLGIHRHHEGDPMDGAHVHTPQNPGGEHVHGEREGMALIDGAHYHKDHENGWHNHKDNDDGSHIVPQSSDKNE